jgi:hypothetical protein
MCLFRQVLDNVRPSSPVNGASRLYGTPDGVLGTLSRLEYKFAAPDSKKREFFLSINFIDNLIHTSKTSRSISSTKISC